uniref:Uncharacterized protein n=1 Tax=Anguilla anguilla TaxID=7936 RepID=A0A0E9UDA3_ANGAN
MRLLLRVHRPSLRPPLDRVRKTRMTKRKRSRRPLKSAASPSNEASSLRSLPAPRVHDLGLSPRPHPAFLDTSSLCTARAASYLCDGEHSLCFHLQLN